MTPIQAIAYAGSLWAGASALFYYTLPLLGVALGYNSSPVAICAFYLMWTGISVFTFKDIFYNRMPNVRALHSDLLVSALFGLGAWVFLLLFSYLPVPQYIRPLEPVTDLLLATPWYFLPKAAEILFQQTLIAAIVFSLAKTFSLRTTVLVYAVAFGAAHLLMLLGGSFPPEVLIMTLAAVISSAVFPYLMIRARHGFLYCYAIHWSFYAALILLVRLMS